jgi:hypothetical protein
VTLQVEDRRTTVSDNSARLVEQVRVILADGLTAAAAPRGLPAQLRVAIVDHAVVLVGGMWNAKTRVRATLAREGLILKEWDAVGQAKRWNALPAYLDAREAAQTGFDRAIEDLMTQLARGAE